MACHLPFLVCGSPLLLILVLQGFRTHSESDECSDLSDSANKICLFFESLGAAKGMGLLES